MAATYWVFFFLASVRQDERDHEYSIMTCRINYMNNHSTQAQAGIPTKKERNKERKRKFTWKLEQDWGRKLDKTSQVSRLTTVADLLMPNYSPSRWKKQVSGLSAHFNSGCKSSLIDTQNKVCVYLMEQTQIICQHWGLKESKSHTSNPNKYWKVEFNTIKHNTMDESGK